MRLSRRALIGAVALGSLGGYGFAAEIRSGLSPITSQAKPITPEERRLRLEKLQGLLTQNKVAALVLESGSTLEYFTGIQWRRSERTTAAVIPASGEVVLITPAFEEPSVRETLAVSGEVRPWSEQESPFKVIVGALKDRDAGTGRIAVESTVRFFIVDGIRQLQPTVEIISGDPFVGPCRMIKSAHELELMKIANAVTITALKYVYQQVQFGMEASDIASLMNKATQTLGGSPEFTLVLLNEASAYPHGSVQPQSVHEGSVVLMDCGCTVHGYQSDISRTWVQGAPTAQHRKIWATVKRGQEIALENAKLGGPVGAIDDAVRAYYEKEGFGPGYTLPGLSHRTGHGIGLDGHEAPYLVHGDQTPLQRGMCFSDEPGLYLPGFFGIRLEDCWSLSSAGPELFTPLAKSIDDPI